MNTGASSTSHSQEHRRVVLAGGRLVDVEAGRVLPEGTSLVLEGSSIIAVLAPGQPPPCTPDVTVDLGGRTVIPGMFNTHCHLQLGMPSLLSGPVDQSRAHALRQRQIEKNLADCLARGITHVRDTLAEDLRPNRLLRDRILSGQLPGPRIHPSVLVAQRGGTFSADRGFMDRVVLPLVGMTTLPYRDANCGIVTFAPTASIPDVQRAVDQAIDERGAQTIKLYEQREKKITYKPGATLMTAEQLEAAVQQARTRGVPVTVHHLTRESFNRALKVGVTSMAHVAYDEALTREELDAFVKNNVILEPTLSLVLDLVWRQPGLPDNDHARMDRLEAIRNRYLNRAVDEFWLPELGVMERAGWEKARRMKFRAFGFMDLSHVYRYYRGILFKGWDNVAALMGRGATVAVGNDGGAVARTPAMIGLELEVLGAALETAGMHLDGAEAVKMCTLHGARALGVQEKYGSLTTGRTADLVVLDQNPLEDWRVLGEPAAAVIMDGRLVCNPCGLAW